MLKRVGILTRPLVYNCGLNLSEEPKGEWKDLYDRETKKLNEISQEELSQTAQVVARDEDARDPLAGRERTVEELPF